MKNYKMHILISSISIKDKPNGVFSRSFNLSRGLAKLGHNVTLLTTHNDFCFPHKTELRDGVKIVSFPTFGSEKVSKFGYSILSLLLRSIYIISKKFDILHADQHRPVSFLTCHIYKLFHRKSKVICDWQDVFGKGGIYNYKSKVWKKTLGPIDNWLEIYSIKKADGVVVLSEELNNRAHRIRQSNENITKIWGGSDVDAIKFTTNSSLHRSKFNINPKDFAIIFVGLEMEDYKNNKMVFDSIKKLKEKGLRIVIIRTGKRFSATFKEEHNIGDEIIEVGYVDYSEYGNLLSCANAFILMQIPNINNLSRWPNVIGDYVAAGRPIIMNLVGELVEFEKKAPFCTLTVDNTTEVSLSFDLTRIYDNKIEIAKLNPIIAKFAKNEFSWDCRARELSEFYTTIR
jgi:glycosyltransferase involved in cell wall biosynthesis